MEHTKHTIDIQTINSGLQELTMDEVADVSGAGMKEAGRALVVAGAIGATSFGGAAWGATAVGVAFATAPIAAIAVVGLAAYAGYTMFSSGGGGGGGGGGSFSRNFEFLSLSR